MFQLPFVVLPSEFITLLKSNIFISTHSTFFDSIKRNQALCLSFEKAIKEFDDGRGFEKTLSALGWTNLRDRMASFYISRVINGTYPLKTDISLVEDIRDLESKFSNHSINGFSRLYLLGFFLKIVNITNQKSNIKSQIFIPDDIGLYLRLSQVKSLKIDWLILILIHLMDEIEDKVLLTSLAAGKRIDDLYTLMSEEKRKMMFDNLLRYGASIEESEFFINDKV